MLFLVEACGLALHFRKIGSGDGHALRLFLYGALVHEHLEQTGFYVVGENSVVFLVILRHAVSRALVHLFGVAVKLGEEHPFVSRGLFLVDIPALSPYYRRRVLLVVKAVGVPGDAVLVQVLDDTVPVVAAYHVVDTFESAVPVRRVRGSRYGYRKRQHECRRDRADPLFPCFLQMNSSLSCSLI